MSNHSTIADVSLVSPDLAFYSKRQNDVEDTLRKRIEELATLNEIGRAINASQFSTDEFNRRKQSKDHFLSQILRGPKIDIIGQSDES